MPLTLEQARLLAQIVLNRRLRGLPPLLEMDKAKCPPPIPTPQDKALPPFPTQNTKPAASPIPPTPASQDAPLKPLDMKLYVERFNAGVLAEHEADLATQPAHIRATKTPEEWQKTSGLEIMKLARDWDAAERANAEVLRRNPPPSHPEK